MTFFVSLWILSLELNQSNLDSFVIGKATVKPDLDALHHPEEEEDNQEDEESSPAWDPLGYGAHFIYASDNCLRKRIHHQAHKSPKTFSTCSSCVMQNHACMPYMPSRNSFSAPK